MGRFFLEVVQDPDGSYYANMVIEGKPVTGLPKNVDYNTLREAIRRDTGVEILKRKDMKFQQFGHKKYAYIDATQYRGEGKDCRVTLEEMQAGWKPDFSRHKESAEARKPSLDEQLRAAETKYCSAPATRSRGKGPER